MDKKGIGKRIQKLRNASGLTQEQLAEKVEISANYMTNIETGSDLCSSTVLIKIANTFDASIDYILGDNLNFNQKYSEMGQAHVELIHEITGLSEYECKHLIKYIALMRELSRLEE